MANEVILTVIEEEKRIARKISENNYQRMLKFKSEIEPELKALLDYMNGMPATKKCTKKLDIKVNTIKQNETRRKEYMNINAFEMNSRRDGKN